MLILFGGPADVHAILDALLVVVVVVVLPDATDNEEAVLLISHTPQARSHQPASEHVAQKRNSHTSCPALAQADGCWLPQSLLESLVLVVVVVIVAPVVVVFGQNPQVLSHHPAKSQLGQSKSPHKPSNSPQKASP